MERWFEGAGQGVSVRVDEDGVPATPPTNPAGYDGLDRFGRITDLWVKHGSTTHNQLVYGYMFLGTKKWEIEVHSPVTPARVRVHICGKY